MDKLMSAEKGNQTVAIKQSLSDQQPRIFVAPKKSSRRRLAIILLALIVMFMFWYNSRGANVSLRKNAISTMEHSENSATPVASTPDPKVKASHSAANVSNGSAVAIPRTSHEKVVLKVVKVDSEETAAEDGRASNAVDGNPYTIWHTQWTDNKRHLYGRSPHCPHEIVIQITPPCRINGSGTRICFVPIYEMGSITSAANCLTIKKRHIEHVSQESIV